MASATISAVVHRLVDLSPATRQFTLSASQYRQRSRKVVENTSSTRGRLTLKDCAAQSLELISRSDGGPPRWFTPLECGSRLKDAPLLLFLPGIDGDGLGLLLHHERLGMIFDIWCFHIPVMDRTSFTDIVKQVVKTVQSENSRKPNRPIYLVGESFGGCLALAVAALNPDVDLKLILANPATSLRNSQMQLQPLIESPAMLFNKLHSGSPYVLSLLSGSASKMVEKTMKTPLDLEQIIEQFSTLSTYLSVLPDIWTVETILWKLSMVKSAAAFANSRLHAIKAETLILISGKDQMFPSREEGERLCRILSKCDIRTFDNCGHFLFLEDGISMISVLTGASFFRRGRYIDYVSDYLPPSHFEFLRVYEPQRWIELATSPVMLSTMESGKIVRSLAGIPAEGPVLFVGYHMMLGLELAPLVSRLWMEKNVLLRGMAHPLMFSKLREGNLPDLSSYDTYRVMGAVPVSAANFYKLLSSNSHVLLYPGGVREALHRKGEEYKLFWPEQSEFIRMAARFGAKIIPFGSVGEDDVGQLLLDYNDLRRIPYFKEAIKNLTDEVVRLRNDVGGEVSNQDIHLPIVLPKIPGRFYFFFGKPIETKGRREELKCKEKADVLYLEIKYEVEKCIDYLKEKREKDPYRNIFTRIAYQAMHGTDSQIPTFTL